MNETNGLEKMTADICNLMGKMSPDEQAKTFRIIREFLFNGRKALIETLRAKVIDDEKYIEYLSQQTDDEILSPYRADPVCREAKSNY